jgi:hypothetical protein
MIRAAGGVGKTYQEIRPVAQSWIDRILDAEQAYNTALGGAEDVFNVGVDGLNAAVEGAEVTFNAGVDTLNAAVEVAEDTFNVGVDAYNKALGGAEDVFNIGVDGFNVALSTGISTFNRGIDGMHVGSQQLLSWPSNLFPPSAVSSTLLCVVDLHSLAFSGGKSRLPSPASPTPISSASAPSKTVLTLRFPRFDHPCSPSGGSHCSTYLAALAFHGQSESKVYLVQFQK